jgi:hypothetical protein
MGDVGCEALASWDGLGMGWIVGWEVACGLGPLWLQSSGQVLIDCVELPHLLCDHVLAW